VILTAPTKESPFGACRGQTKGREVERRQATIGRRIETHHHYHKTSEQNGVEKERSEIHHNLLQVSSCNMSRKYPGPLAPSQG
jgi:hypothetical protein